MHHAWNSSSTYLFLGLSSKAMQVDAQLAISPICSSALCLQVAVYNNQKGNITVLPNTVISECKNITWKRKRTKNYWPPLGQTWISSSHLNVCPQLHKSVELERVCITQSWECNVQQRFGCAADINKQCTVAHGHEGAPHPCSEFIGLDISIFFSIYELPMDRKVHTPQSISLPIIGFNPRL
jgi:hypothetical protein